MQILPVGLNVASRNINTNACKSKIHFGSTLEEDKIKAKTRKQYEEEASNFAQEVYDEAKGFGAPEQYQEFLLGKLIGKGELLPTIRELHKGYIATKSDENETGIIPNQKLEDLYGKKTAQKINNILDTIQTEERKPEETRKIFKKLQALKWQTDQEFPKTQKNDKNTPLGKLIYLMLLTDPQKGLRKYADGFEYKNTCSVGTFWTHVYYKGLLTGGFTKELFFIHDGYKAYSKQKKVSCREW